jgi:hypothetical protein
VKFDTDDFQNNGDAHLQITSAIKGTTYLTSFTQQPIVAASEKIGDATLPAAVANFPAPQLLKSMISI